MEEIWKDVVGFEGEYLVSSMGNIRSFKKYGKNGGLITPQIDKFGYPVAKLWRNGKPVFKKVHRIVAMAFIPNPENKPVIDHINTIRTDNRVENLRWCTVEENVNNPISKMKLSKTMTGRKASEETRRKLSLIRRGEGNSMYGKNHTEETKMKMSVPIVQYTKDGEFVAEYYGAKDASVKTGIHRQNIADALKGRRKCAGGFIWKYKKVEND